MRQRGWRLAAAALALLGAGVAAAQPGRGGITDGVVRIGVLNDQSGLYADLSGPGSVLAARLAVEDFGGSVAGARIEVVAADHQNKPDIGSNTARRWFDVEGVDVVVDVPTSSVALAVSEVARQKNKALLVSGAGTTDLTGKACSPNTVHWTYDTYALAYGTGSAVVKAGGDTWFFLTADYAFGHSLEKEVAQVVEQSGGRVLGGVRHPLNATDFSSFLLQAQASGAEVVGLANAGGDTINAIKSASEFGLTRGGQQLAGLLVFISDVHALGLEAAQGLRLTSAFYWDANAQTRAFSARFAAQSGGRVPTMVHAGVYSAVLHYLKAVQAEGGDGDGRAVVARMKALPTDDPLLGRGEVRADGRKVHPMSLYEVKAPAESRGPWDLYRLVHTIPAAEAFKPLAQSECPLVEGARAAAGPAAPAATPAGGEGASGRVQALMGQLLVGLINGSFYALLSLGLAIIFGLLNVVNFSHGAFYTLGAFAAWALLHWAGVGYWGALVLAPLAVGLLGAVVQRTLLARLQGLDPLYGLLLTFGLALVVQGLLQNAAGSSGLPYPVPDALAGGTSLGFVFLPTYRAWVVGLSVALCAATWFVTERTRLGSYLRASTENPALVQAFGVNVPRIVTVTYGLGVALAAVAGVLAAPVYRVSPLMGSDLIIVVFAVVVIGGMGSILGSVLTGFALGVVEGLTRVYWPEASSTVIFVIMAAVLLVRPAGLFGRAA